MAQTPHEDNAVHNADPSQAFLREDVQPVFADGDLLDQAFDLTGEPYRDVAGRRTLRVNLINQFFFVKLHYGVGWGEVVKNWLQFKRPVVGAENEYVVCRALAEVGIRAPVVAAYARSSGLAPHRRSFVLCDELGDHSNLEEVGLDWLQHPPSHEQLRGLLKSVALFAQRFHAEGFIHRDFYLCHLLIRNPDLANLDANAVELGVLDLHRARRFITPSTFMSMTPHPRSSTWVTHPDTWAAMSTGQPWFTEPATTIAPGFHPPTIILVPAPGDSASGTTVTAAGASESAGVTAAGT